MGIFGLFNKDIIKEIRKVHSELHKLISAFEKSINLFNEKISYLKKFLKFSKKGMEQEFPVLVKKFQHAVLEQLSIESKEEILDKKLIQEVEAIIRNNYDPEDLKQFEELEKELEIFFNDLHAWRQVVLQQKKFLEDNKERIFTEHEYIVRYIKVLLDREYEIIFRHMDAPSMKEIIDQTLYEVNKLFNEWRPHFINSLSFKEITDPNDPDFLELYEGVFKICFPLDLKAFEKFQEVLTASNNGKFGKGRYHIIVLKNKFGKIVAGGAFYFLVDEEGEEFAFGIGEYTAVLPEYRRYAIATTIVAIRLKMLNRDAKTVGFRHIRALLGEYRDEKKTTQEMIEKEGFDPRDRKKFFHQMHMRGLRFEYPNPDLKDRRKIERAYTLGFWSMLEKHKKRVDASFLRKVLRIYYTNYYRVHINHNIVRYVDRMLSRRDYVEIDSLV